MAIILRCQDQWGRTIALTDERWHDHILVNHAEMLGGEQHIRQALTDPWMVMFDKQRKGVENFYRPFTLPQPYAQYYLKVVVRFHPKFLQLGYQGEVLTAFPTDRAQLGETLKWSSARE